MLCKEKRQQIVIFCFQDLRWVWGMTKKVTPINLTHFEQSCLFYVSCLAGVIYDIKSKEMKLLIGHVRLEFACYITFFFYFSDCLLINPLPLLFQMAEPG